MADTARATKSLRINFRISEAEDKLLRRGAQASGQSVTEFIVASACAIAEFELAEERDFRLPPEQWKAFLEALDKPAAANPALRLLLSEPSVIETANPRHS